jgi:hypothetical protein
MLCINIGIDVKDRIIYKGVVFVPMWNLDVELQLALERHGYRFIHLKEADNQE